MESPLNYEDRPVGLREKSWFNVAYFLFLFPFLAAAVFSNWKIPHANSKVIDHSKMKSKSTL